MGNSYGPLFGEGEKSEGQDNASPGQGLLTAIVAFPKDEEFWKEP